MRIAIDARAYSWAGVGRYTKNLLSALAAVNDENEYVILLGKDDISSFKSTFELALKDKFEIREVESSYYSWQEQVIFWQQLNGIEADLFHFTNFNIPLLFNRPYVVTVHDVTRFIFPGQTQQGILRQMAYEIVFKHAVEKARALICVSEATCRDLRQLPFVLPSKQLVIHEAVDPAFLVVVSSDDRQKVSLMVGSNSPYLLYVGVWMSHKNLPRMLKAYVKVKACHPGLKLVITGRPKPGYVNVDKITRAVGLSTDDVIFLGRVSPELLPALYAEAKLLLFPSLYEGFGLPALEATACGAPVVTSNLSSLPEVMGEAAEYVNPEYIPGIVAGVNRVLEDDNYRQRLIIQGKERVSAFSWEKCARKTIDVYKSVV